jgi:hypothetical protein
VKILALMSLAALVACGAEQPPTICTALFAYLTLKVQDPNGMPVSGLAISDTLRRTGQGFNVPQTLMLAPGTYVVFDDNFTSRIRSSGDSIRVAGSKGATGFTADFFFDVPGGCHVRKLAGPDSVTAQP